MIHQFENKNTKILLIGLLLMAIIAAYLCTSYISMLKKAAEEQANHYLTEVASHVSSTINSRVETNFKDFSSIAETYQ